MSEPPLLPAPEPPPDEPPPPRPPRPLLPWLTGAGFLLVVGALIWVWLHPANLIPTAGQPAPLQREIAALDARVSRLEERPPAVPAATQDFAPLAARVAALEQKPPPSQASPDLKPLEARVAALEQRPAPPPPVNLAPIEARLAALEQRRPPDLAPLEARLAALEKTVGHAAHVQAAQTARIALDAGQQLGNLPNAPAALVRFANASPPTEAQLRLEFPKVARAALQAARPDTKDEPLLDRMWSRAQDLVTIRQGDRVVVGNPAAGLLARAQRALDAGDLAGAVAAVGALQGAAAQPMAPWLAQARSLLDARAALAAWAANG